MNHEELVSKFSQTVGIEKAESVVADGLDAVDREPAASYSSAELEELCTTIARRYDGYIALVAQEVRVYQQAQQRFEALLERISDPVVVVEFENDVPVVRGMNPAFQRTFGYDTAAVGSPLPALIVPSDREEQLIDHWLRSNDHTSEVRRQTADGESRTFIFRPVTVTREGGRVEGYGIYVDITDRKRRERQLANQNEQLENFASVVSHDLRNPLNVAAGHCQLARELSDDEAVRTHLDHAAAAHDRMGDLIETLLTLAREGQTVDNPELVSLERVVTETWSNVDTGDAVLQTDALDGIRIAADENRLAEVFENLSRNAVEHRSANPRSQTPEDPVEHSSTGSDSAGQHVRTDHDASRPVVRVGPLRAGDEVNGFYVEDDGPGIPAAQRDRIFDHGFTTRDNGTGFGLAIVETIAEAHGWTVSLAAPADDRGARFEFTGIKGDA